jgi:trigger factor
MLQNLRQQHAVIEPLDQPAKEGDLVYIQISARRLEPQEGENEVLISERSMPVDIDPEGVENPMEWPFPGFSRRLVGLSAGSEIAFDYNYPEDASINAFKGVKASFKVKVEEVKKRTLPELNDEFAQTVGDFATIEALRTRLRENLEEQARQDYNQDYDEHVLDRVVEISTIKYPPQMLEHEIEHVVEHLKERLEQQKLDLDLYLKSRQIDMDGLKEEARPVAESRIKRSLVLMDMAEKMEVKVSEEDLQAETQRTLSGFSQLMPEKEFRKIVSSKESTSGLISNIMMDMVIERTKDRLREIAREPAAAASQSEAIPETISEVEGAAPAEPVKPKKKRSTSKKKTE